MQDIIGDKLSSIQDVLGQKTPDQIEDVISIHSTVAVQVQEVKVEGANSTRDGILRKQFEPIFAPGQTLESVLKELDHAANNIKQLGVFEDLSYYVDLAQSGIDTFTSDTLDLTATLVLKQVTHPIIKLSTITRDDEASFLASAKLRNLFSGAETLDLQASFGTRPRPVSSYLAALEAPLNGSPFVKAHLSGYLHSNNAPWASHSQISRGITAKIISFSKENTKTSSTTVSEIGINSVTRSVIGVEAAAGDTVRAAAGDSLKTSLFGRVFTDSRNNPIYASSGQSLDFQAEVASAAAGDVSFFRSTITSNIARSLSPVDDKLILNASLGSGLLWGLGAPKANPSIVDKFFLGGARNINGFQYNGLGPKDGVDSIGGDAYALGKISFLGKFPRLDPSSPLRFLLFFNGATLVGVEHDAKTSLKSVINQTFSKPSTAAGLGIVYRTEAAQLELIYSVPLSIKDQDLTRKGVQFGVTLSI